MPATVQLNTRIDPELKRRGDAVFARAGLSSSEVVRKVWQVAADTQRVPDCIAPQQKDDDLERRLALVREGAGLAYRMVEEMGIKLVPIPMDYDAMKERMYDDMLDEFHEMMGDTLE